MEDSLSRNFIEFGVEVSIFELSMNGSVGAMS